MKDKSLKILLGIIAVNLTLQTINQIGLFSTAYAQSGVQRIAICDAGGSACVDIRSGTGSDAFHRNANKLSIHNYGN